LSTKEIELTHITWDDYKFVVGELAVDISSSTRQYRCIYGILRGGLIPAVMLSHILGIPVITDVSFPNKDVLIVDDIAHTGNTIEYYRHWDEVMDIATVYARESCRYQPNFCGEMIHDDIWRVFPYEIVSKELKCARADGKKV